MKCIQDYSFHDGEIISIFLNGNYVEILFKKRDCTQIKLVFEDYWEVYDSHSVGQNIDGLLINSSKEIIERASKNILSDGASKEETIGLNSYSFVSSWSENVVFEIAAKNVRIEEISV